MRVWRVLRGVARVALWMVAIAAGLALALVIALRTAPGRRALLRVALPMVNARMAGHLSVRGIDGDLWHRVVLVDARLDDAEGVETIYARRVEARIDLGALAWGRVHVRDLRVEGARLTLRHLHDNRFNLVALGRRDTTRDDAQVRPPPKAKRPFYMEIDHFHVQVDGAYHPPRGHEAHVIEWPRGTFDIEGSAQIAASQLHFRVDRLVSDARDPLHAHVELRGGLLVTPHHGPHGATEIAFDDVVLTATSDGAEIARLHPALHPRGRWQLRAEGGGPLTHLRARAVVSGPRGSVTVDGVLARGEILRWGANLAVAGIDPAADWQGLPRGDVSLALRAGGTTKAGEVTLERLAADAGALHVHGEGHSDFRGRGQGVVRASIDSLAQLGALGVKLPDVGELDGRVALTATLGRDARGPRLEAHVGGERLWLRRGRMRVRAAALSAQATLGPGRPIHVVLAGRQLAIAGVALAKRNQLGELPVRALALTLDGQPRRFSVRGGATLADGTEARFAARARRLPAPAIAATVTELTVARGARRFVLDAPAELRLAGTAEALRIDATVAGAHLAARLGLGRDRLTAEARLDAPALERIGRLGGVPLGGALRADAWLALDERLTLAVTVEGERLRGPHVAIARLHAGVHSVQLVGEAHVTAEGLTAGGVALSRLALDARGTPERLAVTLDGTRAGSAHKSPARLRVALDGRWRTDALEVVSADLVLRTAELTLPRQAWRLAAPAHVHVDRGAARFAGVRVRSDVGELDVDGQVARDAVDVTLQLRNGDLQELSRAVGRPGLLPAARWSGRVHVAGTAAAPLVDAALEARAEKTVSWLGFGVSAMSLRAFADSRHAILHADARGRDDTRVVVDAHGVPRQAGGHIAAVAATIDRLQLTVHGHTWELRAPCLIDVGTRLAVDNCRLGTSGRGEIALRGSGPLAPSSGEALDITLTTRHLDLRDLHALLAPGHAEPPKTDFEIHAHLQGTRRAPVVDVQLVGNGSEIDEGGLPENVNYKISAHYGERRLRGQASMRQAGTRLGIGATFDVPTTLADGEQPISLALEARPVPYYKIRQLLPTTFANLKGFFTLRVNAGGTTRHPHVDAELHMPSWGLDDLRDNNTIANLAYDGRELTVNSVTSFAAQGLLGAILHLHPPRNSGTVTLALRAPVDMVRLLRAPREALHALVHDAPLVVSAEVRDVDLAKVPLELFGFAVPLTAGRLHAGVRGGGTLDQPTLNAEVRAVGLGRAGVIDHLDVEGALAWERGRVHVSGRAGLRGAPLLSFRGVADLDGRRLFDRSVWGDHWRDGALDIDVDVPGYPLARLRNLQPRLHAIDGTLHARAALRGTWGAPDLRVVAQGRDVGLAHGRFARLDADVHLHDARWTFDAGGRDGHGGTVRVDGELPRDWDAPMRMTIDARALQVGFLGALWEEIGDIGGRLDAHVQVSGTRAAPRPTGEAHLEGGLFGFRGDARRYEAALSLRIDGDVARLERLWLRGGGGTLEATGSARLDGLRPTQLALAAHAHDFRFAYGSAAARFDADFALDGDRTDDVFRGALKLSRGSIVLPELGGLGAREDLGGMPDVRFEDARARRDAHERSAGKGAFIAVRVDGPLVLRSREAGLELGGELGVTVAGDALGIAGVVESRPGGSVELLGKRYDVERLQLAFGGAPDDPELHLRVTRRLGQATVAIIIEGTAKNPSVRLTCDPPVYDATQLTSLVLAGRAGSERIAVRDLDRQITGLLSALVIRKIREQLAPSLPIDLVRPLDQQSYAEFSAAPVEVGRFVSDRIYVRYEQRYGGSRLGRSASNSDEASAEVRLGKGFELTTTFGDGGVGGIYLFWTARH